MDHHCSSAVLLPPRGYWCWVRLSRQLGSSVATDVLAHVWPLELLSLNETFDLRPPSIYSAKFGRFVVKTVLNQVAAHVANAATELDTINNDPTIFDYVMQYRFDARVIPVGLAAGLDVVVCFLQPPIPAIPC